MTVAELLKNHPAADAWPMMDDDRYGELLADIQANGQREPITLCDGMILDGRNRYRACVELDIEPLTRSYVGDPWAFAWSLNGARRDLEATVRALIFKRCEDGSAKWVERLKKIAEEGNRKKSEAAKAGRVGRAAKKAIDDVLHWAMQYRKSKVSRMKVQIALAHGDACYFKNRGKGPCCGTAEWGHIAPRCRGGADPVENGQIECRAHNHQRGVNGNVMTIEEYLASPLTTHRDATLV